MPQFQFSTDRTAAPPIGASVARSDDDTVTVALFGNSQDAGLAERILAAYLTSNRRMQPDGRCKVGYVLHDRANDYVALVAAPIGEQLMYWALNAGQLQV